MGKINNALKMLAIIRSRKKVTRKELAEELEIGIREVTRYKDALEYAGVYIKHTTGKNGGYELIGKDYLLDLDVTADEIKALNSSIDYLKKNNIAVFRDINHLSNKIKAAKKIEEDEKLSYYNIGSKVKINYEEEREKWLIINDGILNNRKIEINYKNANGITSTRIVHPYGLYTYHGASYFVGLCESRFEERQFKLIRIEEVKLLKEKFEKTNFKLKDYLHNRLGLFNDEEYKVKLKISYPYAQSIKEVHWVENEVVEDHFEEGYIIYKGKLKGKKDVLEWILKMGSNCKIIEPISLRDEVVKKCNEILDIYSF